MLDELPFAEVWAVDFEFRPKDGREGNRPDPTCLVAYELKGGRKLRLWQDEFGPFPPYSVGPNSIFVAYYASAEIGCHLALGWPKPARILDLFTEFRCHTNGVRPSRRLWATRRALLFRHRRHGCDRERRHARSSPARRAMVRSRTQGQFSIIVKVMLALWQATAADAPPHRSSPRAPPRAVHGRRRDDGAQRRADRCSTPGQAPREWADIQDQLIADIDPDYGVFDGRTFKADRFATWLATTGYPWPRLDSGRLDLSDDTFRQMAKAHPAVSPLRELRSSLV